VFKPIYEQHTATLESRKVVFSGITTVALGDGDDSLNLARDAQVAFKMAVTFDGKRGTNSANYRVRNLSPIPLLLNFRLFA
jgi:hypothetical protein